METVGRAEVIPILGMHRSGTSALAGALHKLGADLGPESSWRKAATDNPRAFFDCVPVLDLNRDVLAAFEGTWSSPPPLPPGWVEDERLTNLRDRAEQLSTGIPERRVIEDPCLSLLEPLWEEVGSVLAGVLCVRYPAAVANSLRVRNQFTVDQGLFLWFRYNAAAKLNCPDALVVEYESLFADPETHLKRAADHIGLEVSERTLGAAAGTVHRRMEHHEASDQPDTPIGEVCGRLYELLRSGQALEADHDLWIWARLVTELPWAGPGDREIGRARRLVDESRLEIDRLTDENQRWALRLRRVETELQHALKALDIASISETGLFMTQKSEL